MSVNLAARALNTPWPSMASQPLLQISRPTTTWSLPKGKYTNWSKRTQQKSESVPSQTQSRARKGSFDLKCIVRIIRLFGMLDLLICLVNREMKERMLLRKKAKAHCIYILQKKLYDEMIYLREQTRDFFSSGIVDSKVDLFKYQHDLFYGQITKNHIATSIALYHLQLKHLEQKYRTWLTPSELNNDLLLN